MQARFHPSEREKLLTIQSYINELNAQLTTNFTCSLRDKLKHYLITAKKKIEHGENPALTTLSLKGCLPVNSLSKKTGSI